MTLLGSGKLLTSNYTMNFCIYGRIRSPETEKDCLYWVSFSGCLISSWWCILISWSCLVIWYDLILVDERHCTIVPKQSLQNKVHCEYYCRYIYLSCAMVAFTVQCSRSAFDVYFLLGSEWFTKQ
jgi:hypothetical protein